MALTSFTQLLNQEVGNGQVSDAVLGFGVVLDADATCSGSNDGRIDEDRGRFGIQVNVVPAEREEFPGSDPGRDQEV